MTCSPVTNFFNYIKENCRCCCCKPSEDVLPVENVIRSEDVLPSEGVIPVEVPLEEENRSIVQFFLCIKEYIDGLSQQHEGVFDLLESDISVVKKNQNFLLAQFDRNNILEITYTFMKLLNPEFDQFESFSRVNVAARLLGIDLHWRYLEKVPLTFDEDLSIRQKIRRIEGIVSKAAFSWSYVKRFDSSHDVNRSDLYEWGVITDSQIELLREKENIQPNFFEEIKKVNAFVELKIEEISFFIELSAYFLPSYSSYHRCSKGFKEDLKASALISIPGITLSSQEVEEKLEESLVIIKNCMGCPKMLKKLTPFVKYLFSYIKETTDKQILRERYFLSDAEITNIYNELCVNPNLFEEIKEVESFEMLPETSLCSLYKIAKFNFLQNSSEGHALDSRLLRSYSAKASSSFGRDRSTGEISYLVSDM
jgi:hypothetical protein